MMITALKITADSTADSGVLRRMMFSAFRTGKVPANIAGMMEVFRHVVGDRERGQRAARHQKLLADFDHFDEFGRVRVEIDHVAGFLSGLRAGIHGTPTSAWARAGAS